MPHPEDTIEQLARLARDDEVLHAASERRKPAPPSSEEVPPASVLPDSLTQPLSEAQRSSFVDAIQARLANAEHAPAQAPVVPIARGRRSALVAAVALTAAAAGALFALRGSPDAEGPLSHYEARLEGSEQSERGGTQAFGQLRLRPSSKLRFELRPKSDERGSVRVRAFVQGSAAPGASETHELELTQEQSAAGAVRVSAQLTASLPVRGQLLLYVGRPAAIAHAAPHAAPKDESREAPGDAQEFRWQFERVQ